jgi:tetratricopeptide (TPR) repeat protein
LSRNYIQYAQNREAILKEFSTPTYMSPEQFRSARQKDINHLSDIYSLGVILFEILDGHVPFDGRNFDELKEKHVSFVPPRLEGDLAPWGKIVGRCLAKAPGERYQSVAELLSDLDNAVSGVEISVDVRCPKCGHVNVNRDLRRCEICNSDLSEKFRPCPRCYRLNRLDVDVCPKHNLEKPGCGYEIGRHYKIKELLEAARELRDVDPLEAIRNLRKVQDLDRSNKDANEMLPDLWNLQNSIDDIVPEAEKAEGEGRVEDAKQRWQDVLDLVPRHRIALREKARLDELIASYNESYDRSTKMMDEGRYSEARELLNACKRLIPTRKETDTAFKALNERERIYATNLEEAKSDKRLLMLTPSLLKLATCLKQSPKSKEVLRLKAEVEEGIRKAKELYKESMDLADSAEFDQAIGKANEVKSLRKDFDIINRFLDTLKSKKSEYDRVKLRWQEALKEGVRDLDLAEEELKKGLAICPRDEAAKGLLEEVERDKDASSTCLNKVPAHLRAANFDRATEKFNKAMIIWPKNPRLQQSRERIELVRKNYQSCRTAWEEALDDKVRDLELAEKELTKSIGICPDSSDSAHLLEQVREEQKAAIKLLGEAEDQINHGHAQAAIEQLKEAQKVWSKVPGVQIIRDRIQGFLDLKKKWEEALKPEVRDLDSAEAEITRGLSLYPNAKELTRLLQQVGEDKRKARNFLSEAERDIRAANFDSATEVLICAESLWRKLPDLQNVRAQISPTRKKWNLHFGNARGFYNSRRLDLAEKELQEALKICPLAADAAKRLEHVRQEQGTAKGLLAQAKENASAADFSSARGNLTSAERFWQNLPGLDQGKKEVDEKERSFTKDYNKAEELYKAGNDLNSAVSCVISALQACPKSKKASDLKIAINNRIIQNRNRREKRRRLLVAGSLLIVAAVIVGGVLQHRATKNRELLKEYYARQKSSQGSVRGKSVHVGEVVGWDAHGNAFRNYFIKPFEGADMAFLAGPDTKGNALDSLSKGDVIEVHLIEYSGWNRASELYRLEKSKFAGWFCGPFGKREGSFLYVSSDDQYRYRSVFRYGRHTKVDRQIGKLSSNEKVRVYYYKSSNPDGNLGSGWAYEIHKFCGFWSLGLYLDIDA